MFHVIIVVSMQRIAVQVFIVTFWVEPWIGSYILYGERRSPYFVLLLRLVSTGPPKRLFYLLLYTVVVQQNGQQAAENFTESLYIMYI